MKINMINIYILFILYIYSSEIIPINFNYLVDREMGLFDLLKPITESFKLDNITSINNLNLTEKCKSILNKTYFLTGNFSDKSWRNRRNTEKVLYYFSELFLSSSKNKNDLGSPEKCENNNELDFKNLGLSQKLSYISVLIEYGKSYYECLKNNNYSPNNFLGLCIIEGCEKEDYIKLIKNGINNINNYDEYNKTFDNQDISIFYLKNRIIQDKIYIKIIKFIPLFFIIIHILFVVFKCIPLFLYNLFICIFCCQRNNKKKKGSVKIKRILSKDKGQLIPKDANYSINSSISQLSMTSNADKFNEMLNLLFDIKKNFKSLKDYKKQDENANNSGLSYINGLKGISMIFLLFGNVFIVIYNSPFIEPNINNFYKILTNFFYFIFYIGIKFAPKILICCSGFTLFYKFVCFLDDKVEIEKDIIKQREENVTKNEKSINNKNNAINSSKSNKNKRNSGNISFNFKSLVSVKYLWIFIGYQLHKYCLYLLMMGFFLFSFYEAISFFHGPGPVWDFLNQKMVEPSYKIGKIFPLLFGFQGFLLPFLRNDKYNILNYFNLVYQEIFYFLISSIFIFIGYKKNMRIDLYCKIFIIFLLFSRILLYFSLGFLNIRDYFSFQSSGLFYNSLFYNYIYYLLGIYFGMLNYTIQKRFSVLDCKKNKKIYLINIVQVIELIKKRKKFPLYLIIIFIVFLLLIVFLQKILILIFELINNSIQDCITSYDKKIFVDILMLIDSDIIILGINIMAIFLYLKGNNIINDFINHNFWIIFNKLYFSFILFINPIILYVIYITETKIKFDIKNCFLYTFICGFLVFGIASFIYVVFELPYKNAIRYWFKLSEKEINDERFNNIETNFNNSQIENQQDLLDENNSDEEEYIEEEDEEEYD